MTKELEQHPGTEQPEETYLCAVVVIQVADFRAIVPETAGLMSQYHFFGQRGVDSAPLTLACTCTPLTSPSSSRMPRARPSPQALARSESAYSTKSPAPARAIHEEQQDPYSVPAQKKYKEQHDRNVHRREKRASCTFDGCVKACFTAAETT